MSNEPDLDQKTFSEEMNAAAQELLEEENLQHLKVQRSDDLEYGLISILPSLAVLGLSSFIANGDTNSSVGVAIAVCGALSTLYSSVSLIRGYLNHRSIQRLESNPESPSEPAVP